MKHLTKGSLEEAVRAIEARASADPVFRRHALDHPMEALASVLNHGSSEERLLGIVRHTPPFQIYGSLPRLSEANRLRAEMDGVTARLFT